VYSHVAKSLPTKNSNPLLNGSKRLKHLITCFGVHRGFTTAFTTHNDPEKKVYIVSYFGLSHHTISLPNMTSATQLDTSSLSRKFKINTVDNSSKLDAAENTPASFVFCPSGVTREPCADDSANAVQVPAQCASPLIRPTNGTDVYISMRADGTYNSGASGIFFSPSFLAASDQASFDL